MSDRSVANYPPAFFPSVATTPAVPRPVAARTRLLLEGRQQMYRSCLSGFLAGIIGLMSVTQAVGQQVCSPTLAFKEVQFSDMQPPTLERRWTAVVSVDASRCVANSRGFFEIVFTRLKEIGPEIEFRERFIWLPPAVKVGVDFWADEAVERYWIDNITPCRCAG
jgi:hypothetical protein